MIGIKQFHFILTGLVCQEYLEIGLFSFKNCSFFVLLIVNIVDQIESSKTRKYQLKNGQSNEEYLQNKSLILNNV